MGLFTKFKALNAYERALESYGIRPRSIDPDVHGRICSYTNQQYEYQINVEGKYRNDENLKALMHQSASLVAYCMLGPRKFPDSSNYKELTNAVVRAAARDWSESGPESSLEAKIIDTLNDYNLLDDMFIKFFNIYLNCNSQYTSFEDWYQIFRFAAGEENQDLKEDDDGNCVLDYLNQGAIEVFEEAFDDDIDPVELAIEYAEQYNISDYFDTHN